MERKCPVCKNTLKSEDYLVGRLWEQGETNKVHVSGCTRCVPVAVPKK
ncbi:MAG: hypothetical protein JW969_15185 [Spirochaetales bacterium]|nr:hypothetical protein [Spirochaetales bacterium]